MSSDHGLGSDITETDELALRTIAQNIRASVTSSGLEVDGGCVELSEFLCQELCRQGYAAKTVQGVFRTDRPYEKWGPRPDPCTAVHQWIEVNGLIVDAAADQFNHYLDAPVNEIVIGDRNKMWRYEMPGSE